MFFIFLDFNEIRWSLFLLKKNFLKKGVALVHLSFTLDSDQQVT